MKTLELICDCGKRRAYRGKDSSAIIAEIDCSGWEDYSDDARPLPRGQQHATCPKCSKRAAEEEAMNMSNR